MLSCLFSLLLAIGCTSEQNPPNVVIFYVDDYGWRDYSAAGSDFYETPSIDRFMEEAVNFTQAYSNAPNCAPSRASLMSGQYTPRHGIYTVHPPDRGDARLRKLIPVENLRTLDPSIVTLGEIFQKQGYATAHFGKWHLGDSSTVQSQGFELNMGGYQSGSPGRGGYHSPFNYPGLRTRDKGHYLTDALTDSALHFMEQKKEQPFFMYLSHYAVHSPIQPTKDLLEKYQAKTPGELHSHPGYAAMVENLDYNFGRIMKKLEALDLRSGTLVIFYSDNGGLGYVTRMDPLSGAKGNIYEGGIRVPLAISWPGIYEGGKEVDIPVIGTDLMPTLVEIIGAPAPDQIADGVSLTPLLKGSESTWVERPIFWHFPAYLQGYRNRAELFRIRPCSAVRLGKYKLIHFYEDNRYELYDLESDIGEQFNLMEESPEVAERMKSVLNAWIELTQAPIPATPNPEFDPEYFQEVAQKYEGER